MDWNSWILQKNADSILERLGLTRQEFLEKAKYMPMNPPLDVSMQDKPAYPKAPATIPQPSERDVRQEFERVKNHPSLRHLPEGQILHAVKAKMIRDVAARNEQQMSGHRKAMSDIDQKHKAQMQSRVNQSRNLPLKVLGGARLNLKDVQDFREQAERIRAGEGSVTETGRLYTTLKDKPDWHLSPNERQAPQQAEESAYGPNSFRSNQRARNDRTHRLSVAYQGQEDSPFDVFVSPEEYERGLTTGYHTGKLG